jgi:hypothetical protein
LKDWKFVPYFLKVYFTALPGILWKTTLAVVLSPRDALQFGQLCLNQDDLRLPSRVLGSREPREAFPCTGDVLICGPYNDNLLGGTQMLLELAVLASASRVLRPKTIFEIGTHVGRTGRVLLMNSGPEARLFTLDLPRHHCKYRPGADLMNTPEASRTNFLTGDSGTFDFSPWFGQCELVWVDAAHDYEHVRVDTRNALKLVAPGGWILWHDYRHTAWWSGVTRCLHELKTTHDSLFHVKGTTIAALRIDKP